MLQVLMAHPHQLLVQQVGGLLLQSVPLGFALLLPACSSSAPLLRSLGLKQGFGAYKLPGIVIRNPRDRYDLQS